MPNIGDPDMGVYTLLLEVTYDKSGDAVVLPCDGFSTYQSTQATTPRLAIPLDRPQVLENVAARFLTKFSYPKTSPNHCSAAANNVAEHAQRYHKSTSYPLYWVQIILETSNMFELYN